MNIQNNLGETPIIRYIKRGHTVLEDIQFLVERGSDLDCNSVGCSSALTLAIDHTMFSVVPYLKRHMVNLNHKGKGGNTALHVALLKGILAFCHLLIFFYIEKASDGTEI